MARATWQSDNGDFTDPANWDTNIVPGFGDTAIIASGTANYVIQVPFGSGAVIDNITIDLGGPGATAADNLATLVLQAQQFFFGQDLPLAGTLTLGSGVTIAHTGRFAEVLVEGAVVNQGTLDNAFSDGEIVYRGNGDVLRNDTSGIIQVSNGDFLGLDLDVRNDGVITADGASLALGSGNMAGTDSFAELTGTGTITLANGATVTDAAVRTDASLEFKFLDAGSNVLRISGGGLANFSARITGFGGSNTIDLTGSTIDRIELAGGTLTVIGQVGDGILVPIRTGVLGRLFFDGDYTAQNFVLGGSDGFGGRLLQFDPACFVAGTRIAMGDGAMPIELIRPGMVVRVPGGVARVRWIGRRLADLTDAPDAAPILFAPGSLGDGVPERTLAVSGDHAMRIGGALVLARLLVNGQSIRRAEASGSVAYWHLELDGHDIVFAEGAPCESYRDTGNRAGFELWFPNALIPREPPPPCLPILTDPNAVKAIWSSLGGSDTTASLRACGEPPRVLADGRAVPMVARSPEATVYALPPGCRQLRLRSAAARPHDATPWTDDRRRLGVFVRELAFDHAPMPLDGPMFGDGWHAPEQAGRWTDGDAIVAVPTGAGLLRLLVA